ncbi:MAG TPA: signal peptidase II [Chloroflexota bacterium]|nr:signal peptidase II [Chloroflexota bacterium]
MRPLPRLVLALLVVTFCVGCDQGTKYVAAEALRGAPPRSYVWDTVRLFYFENPGSFLGLGAGLPEPVRYALFVAGIGAILVALIAFLLLAHAPAPTTVAGLALLIGGAASNWFDRVRHGNVVVDFLNVGIGPLRTGVFNLADLLLELGLLILLLRFAAPRERHGRHLLDQRIPQT